MEAAWLLILRPCRCDGVLVPRVLSTVNSTFGLGPAADHAEEVRTTALTDGSFAAASKALMTVLIAFEMVGEGSDAWKSI